MSACECRLPEWGEVVVRFVPTYAGIQTSVISYSCKDMSKEYHLATQKQDSHFE